MIGFRKVAMAAGLAVLGFTGAFVIPTSSAEAQVVFGGTGGGPYYRQPFRGGFAPAPGFRRSALPAYRPVGAGFYPRGVGYRTASYGYRAPGYGWGRSAYYGYGGYSRAGYYPGYGYGYPYRGYGYGYPYYRRYDNSGAIAAGLIGGLALGAIAANAARPVYYQRPAYSDCWYERRRIVNRYGTARVRQVRVCA